MPDHPSTVPEFSRPVDLSRVGTVESVHDIAATPDERAALARRFELLDLVRLEARVTLRRIRGGRLRLNAHLSAEVTQACVATLAPVASRIDEDFTVLYSGDADAPEVMIDAGDDSVVEPWPEGPLDIGEAVAQELALALDPYPHAPGTGPDSAPVAETSAVGAVNPFAALAKLKPRPR